MRILMIATRVHPDVGGVERHVEAVSRELEALGHSVVRVAIGSGRTLASAIPRLLRVLAKDSYDVVHAHDFVAVIVAAFALLLRGRKLRPFATIHGYEGFPLRALYILGHRVAHVLARRVIAVGGYIDVWYRTRSTLVIHGGVAPPPRLLDSNGEGVVFIGRFAEDNNALDVARAFADLSREFPGVPFKLYGFGPQESVIRSAVASAPGVQLCGRTLTPEREMGRAEVVVANSYLAILEAFSMGKPVVSIYGNALKRDYLRELSSCCIGLATTGDVEGLTSALRHLLSDRSGNLQMRDLVRSFGERMSWANIARDYLALWGGAS